MSIIIFKLLVQWLIGDEVFFLAGFSLILCICEVDFVIAAEQKFVLCIISVSGEHAGRVKQRRS